MFTTISSMILGMEMRKIATQGVMTRNMIMQAMIMRGTVMRDMNMMGMAILLVDTTRL